MPIGTKTPRRSSSQRRLLPGWVSAASPSSWMKMAAIIQASPALYSCSTLLSGSLSNLYLSRLRTAMSPAGQARRGFSFQEDNSAAAADLYHDASLKIVEYPDPRLRSKNKRISTFDESLKKLADKMFDVMYKEQTARINPLMLWKLQNLYLNPVVPLLQYQELLITLRTVVESLASRMVSLCCRRSPQLVVPSQPLWPPSSQLSKQIF